MLSESRSSLGRRIAFILVCASVPRTFAAAPRALSLNGQLFAANGVAITNPNVRFRVEVLDPAEACVLYSEMHGAQNLGLTGGRFNLTLGAGTSAVNNVSASGTLDAAVFANRGVTAVAGCASPTVNFHEGDVRSIKIAYDVGGGFVNFDANIPVVSSAYALVAETLDGRAAADFLQVATTGSAALSQVNAEYAFSTVNWPRLRALLDGTSNQYLPTTPIAPIDFNGQRAINVAAPVNPNDAVNKTYADQNLAGRAIDTSAVGPMTNNGATLLWDATANRWVAGQVTTTPTGTAGGALAGTYPNPQLADNVITAAKIKSSGVAVNRLIITDATTGANLNYAECVTLGHVLSWTGTGWECTSVATLAPVTSVAGKVGVVTLNAGDIGGLGTAAMRDVGTAAGQIPLLDGGARMPAVDGSQLTLVNAYQLRSRDVSTVAPTPGQVLAWNGSAWTPTAGAAGSVTSITAATGLLGGTVTTAGTISVDVGTSANKIVQLNASAQVPAVDGSLLANVNAVKIQTRTISSAVPGPGQVLGFNSTTTTWEPTTTAAGSVVSVAGGTGLLGGPVTSNGTLSVDAGTGANKIVQLNSFAQIPAVDGSLLTNVNAVKLQARAVSTAAPGPGQVLGFNSTTTTWEPTTGAAGSVISVAGGTGLLGGPVTSNGTLRIDVGTGANQIVQLNASSRLPAVDGSLLTFVNAVRLQSTAISSTAPTPGQVLAFNATSSQWTPSLASAGSVTNVAGGTGLLGGPVTSSGTLSVDVGTTASKILQLNASAQIPAVDGSLLTNINAVKLQTRTISAAAPGPGQVLGFNSTTTTWEPTTGSAGSVTSVAGGTGLLGGPVTSNGTLAVDVGTAANKIVQLNASAQIPAVDGSLLTNINAVKLQARTVSSVAPGPGQVLGFNSTTTLWEPTTAAAGSVVSVAGGTGLLGGPVISNGTLSVDVGTSANKIVQLNPSGQMPAVDGSLLSSINAVKLQTRVVSAAVPAAGQVLGFNSTTTTWEPTTGSAGSVTSIAGGTGLLGGPVTSNGTLAVDVGTGANKIVQLNGSAQLPAVDGSSLTNVNAVKLQARVVSPVAPGPGQVLGFNSTTTTWEPTTASAGSVVSVASGTGLLGGPVTSNGTLRVDVGTGANQIVQLNASSRLPAVDGSLLTFVNAVRLQTTAVSTVAPTAGQILAFNASSSQWTPLNPSAGSVTSVAGGTGLLGGPVIADGTLSVDVGTGANKIVQLNASAQLPAVDGSQLYSVNAVKLQTRAVSAATPIAGQLLGFNATTTAWEPTTGAAGSVVSVAGGAGLIGGPVTSNGTLAVDVGTAANKILQLNASAQVPAVDGSLLANINAVKLQTRTVSSAAPGPGQVLGFNSVTTTWEPTTAAAGSVVSVAGGIGLLGGPVTSNGTLRVDVGTGANQIIQLNASARLPAVDGSQVTAVNAVKLQTRAVSSAAPTAGQTLAFNATLTQWEPSTPAVGSVVSIVAGTGLLGGTITTNGTLNVDVGSLANQVVRENGNAQIVQQNGTLANPSFSFASDPSVGVYSPGASQLALVANGTVALGITNGLLYLGTVRSGSWQGDPVQIPYGGTGATSFTAHGVLLGAAVGPLSVTAPGGVNSVLTGVAGADPVFTSTPSVLNLNIVGTSSGRVTLAAPDAVTSYALTLPPAVAASSGQVLTSDTSGTLSWTTPVTSASTITGILPVANGGTGQSSTSRYFVFAGPSTGAGAPDFRALVAGDLPTTAALTTGNNVTAAMNIGPTSSQNLNLITGNSTRFTIDTNGNAQMSTTATGPQLNLSNTFNRSVVQADTYTNSTTASTFMTRKGRGFSSAPPAVINSNDVLGTFAGKGYGGASSNWTDVAYYDVGVEFRSAEAFTTTNHGTRINFYTTPLGTSTKANRMTLNEYGQLSINNPAGSSALTAVANAVTNTGVAAQLVAALPNVPNKGGWFQAVPSHTADPGSDEYGALIQMLAVYGAGVTNANSDTASYMQALRNGLVGATDNGTLNYQNAGVFFFGHSSADGGSSPRTVLSKGIYIQPVVQTGIVDVMYDLHLAPPAMASAGTIGSHFGLYSETSAPSEFFGSVGIGIGSNMPASRLQVGGDITPGADNSFDLGQASLRFRDIYAANAVINTSDERQKRAIKNSELGLDFVLKLRPVSYVWANGGDPSRHYGLIAQETKRALAATLGLTAADGIVAYDEKSDRYGLRYTEFIGPIIKAIQDLYALVNGTRAEVETLKRENALLRSRNDALEERMNRLERTTVRGDANSLAR